MEGERDNETILEMIEAGVFAGAYSALARRHPDAAPGFLKMRNKHSARVAALAERVCREAAG